MGSGNVRPPKVDVVGICNVMDDEVARVERFSVAVVVVRVVVTCRGSEQGGHHPKKSAMRLFMVANPPQKYSRKRCFAQGNQFFSIWPVDIVAATTKTTVSKTNTPKRRTQIRAFLPVGSPSKP